MMSFARRDYDAIFIGGGFYGCCLALAFADRFSRILIVERQEDLLTRASYANQARVHNGYHYPRSLLTAGRSAVNYPRFMKEFEGCIDSSFQKIYAIARGSKVTAYQFSKFCQRVGIPARKAPPAISRLFNETLIEETFVTEESAFDAVKLRQMLKEKLANAGVEVAYSREVERVRPGSSRNVSVLLSDGAEVEASYVFNCTYSHINEILARSGLPQLPLKHEMTELALVRMPPQLEHLGITVMDGAFFSAMPFPALGLHTLSHVTYTPHASYSDLQQTRPSNFEADRPSKHVFMLKDSQRYVPLLKEARYMHSHFETKTVLLQNEIDDGRPILCRGNYGMKGLFVVLGAKIDNIYDIIQAVETGSIVPEVAYGTR
ncbi:MAG TPA: FAD-dependent oxidoreductase [Bryobacteraceae bacterium]|nr:FAD-dependent oxidoreductase [Bryobacteraceae bacterium]